MRGTLQVWQTLAMSLTRSRFLEKHIYVVLAMFGVLFFLAAQSHAAPLTWHLQGVTFADGGTASGSFVFDADSTAYSNINMVTTAGSSLPGATYSNLYVAFPNALIALQTAGAPQGSTALQFLFASNLTNAGGTVNILVSSNSFEGTCDASQICASNPLRRVTAGAVTAANAVPEPATAALVPAALLALAITRRAAGNRR